LSVQIAEKSPLRNGAIESGPGVDADGDADDLFLDDALPQPLSNQLIV
jgi:hypothetical protein